MQTQTLLLCRCDEAAKVPETPSSRGRSSKNAAAFVAAADHFRAAVCTAHRLLPKTVSSQQIRAGGAHRVLRQHEGATGNAVPGAGRQLFDRAAARREGSSGATRVVERRLHTVDSLAFSRRRVQAEGGGVALRDASSLSQHLAALHAAAQSVRLHALLEYVLQEATWHCHQYSDLSMCSCRPPRAMRHCSSTHLCLHQ